MSNTKDMDDLSVLYIKFCEGNRKAQRELYDGTSKRLFNYVLGKSDISVEEAAELMQETWLKLWKACSVPLGVVTFDARMYTIAKNLVIDNYRARKKTKKRTTVEEEAADDEQFGEQSAGHGFNKNVSIDSVANNENGGFEWQFPANDIYDDPMLLYVLKKAIKELPFLQRQAWILMQDGKSIEEISQLTESDTEAVRSRIRYANSKIKKCLEEEGG